TVAEQVGTGPAESEHDERAEQRVVHHAGDQFHVPGGHRLHDDGRLWLVQHVGDGRVRVHDGHAVGQVETYRADVALVHDGGVGGFDDHGEAQPVGGGDGFGGGGGDRGGHQRYAVAAEERG